MKIRTENFNITEAQADAVIAEAKKMGVEYSRTLWLAIHPTDGGNGELIAVYSSEDGGEADRHEFNYDLEARQSF